MEALALSPRDSPEIATRAVRRAQKRCHRASIPIIPPSCVRLVAVWRRSRLRVAKDLAATPLGVVFIDVGRARPLARHVLNARFRKPIERREGAAPIYNKWRNPRHFPPSPPVRGANGGYGEAPRVGGGGGRGGGVLGGPK